MRSPRSWARRTHAVAATSIVLLVALACDRGKALPATHDTESVVPLAPSHIDSTIGSAPGTIVLLKADSLRDVANRLLHESTTGRTLSGGGGYRLVVSRRSTSGSPEVHEQWMDVTFVQAGRATVVAGGRLEGGRHEPGGEWRSGTILGGSPYAVSTGDVLVIPAGIPHQFALARGDTIRYLTVKVPRSEHP